MKKLIYASLIFFALRLIKLFYRAKKIDKDQFVQIYLEMTNGSCEKDLFTLDSKVVGFF